MSTYRAIVKDSYQSPPVLRNLEPLVPGNGEVLVRVLAAPFVSYMKQVLDGSRKYPLIFPLTPGMNAIARVEAVGPDAVALRPGQLVFCDITVRGRDNPNVEILMGVHLGSHPASQILMEGPWRSSTYAELAKFPLENVFALNEEILCGQFKYSFADLSYLGSCLVPYGGLADIDVKAGDTVIVAPATGRFGGSAVTTALATGATVIAAGRNVKALELFEKAYGNTGRIRTTVLTGEFAKDLESFKRLAPTGADAYIDFSPREAAKSEHILAGIQALRRGGRLSLMGGILGNIEIPYIDVMHMDIRIHGKFMYERAHILQAIQMVEKGNLAMGKEKAGVESVIYGLDRFEESLETLATTGGWGTQIVIQP